MKKFLRFVLILSFFTILACKKKLELSHFELADQSQSFSENNYAVICVKYITSLDIPGDNGISVTQMRQGEIYKVQDSCIIKTEKGQSLWLKVKDSWLSEDKVQLYNSFEKAKTASKEILK